MNDAITSYYNNTRQYKEAAALHLSAFIIGSVECACVVSVVGKPMDLGQTVAQDRLKAMTKFVLYVLWDYTQDGHHYFYPNKII